MNFVDRHIGPNEAEITQMLQSLGLNTLQALVDKTVPKNISAAEPLSLPDGISEVAVLKELKEKVSKNEVWRSFIGLGYFGTITPSVIQRNILENPGWYTQYTPYQAEISQGRLEALLNFQTMICELTGLDVANASMLDEGTAAAEAMTLAYRVRGSETRNIFLVSATVHPHTKDVIETRAEPLGIRIETLNPLSSEVADDVFGVLVQYPDTFGSVADYSNVSSSVGAKKALMIVATIGSATVPGGFEIRREILFSRLSRYFFSQD